MGHVGMAPVAQITAAQNNALKRTSSRFSSPARRLTQCSTGSGHPTFEDVVRLNARLYSLEATASSRELR